MKAFLRYLFIILTSAITGACQSHQSISPGYDFGLFKNTPVQKLARAVEAEDTSAISKIVKADKPNIDFQESRFGETLLSLAILNYKVLSIEQLLKLGANPNIKSPITGESPFLDFCKRSSRFSTSSETLQTLIKYGGDVNAINLLEIKDTLETTHSNFNTALLYVCAYGNIATLRVLVDNGAKLDVYPIEGEGSLITNVLLADNFDMLKYFLIEKQLTIPGWCFVKYPGQASAKKMTITDALIEDELPSNPKRDKLKQDILEFLKAKHSR